MNRIVKAILYASPIIVLAVPLIGNAMAVCPPGYGYPVNGCVPSGNESLWYLLQQIFGIGF